MLHCLFNAHHQICSLKELLWFSAAEKINRESSPLDFLFVVFCSYKVLRHMAGTSRKKSQAIMLFFTWREENGGSHANAWYSAYERTFQRRALIDIIVLSMITEDKFLFNHLKIISYLIVLWNRKWNKN